MYELMTYETILGRMMEKAAEYAPGIDTRQSSPLYAALAAAAIELQNMYIELDYNVGQFFADTQDRENLIKRCLDIGIKPDPAKKAVLRGEFNIDIPIGSRFSLDILNYSAIKKINDGIYEMECETPGEAGNKKLGVLIPVDYIAGLTRAELTGIISPGSEEEETEHLRTRYFTAVQKPSTSGNVYDYYNWAMECSGVGAAKIFPLADGPGTVKVIITDSERTAAEETLIKKVKEHIEELRPIGATVSVISAVEKKINIKANVRIRNGTNLGSIQSIFTDAVTEFLKNYALQADYISLARIGNILINTEGVEDYADLTLNDTSGNIKLSETETPVIGTIMLEVM